MLAGDKENELQLAYDLLSRCPDGILAVLEIFEKYIVSTGSKEIQNIVEPAVFVEKLVSVYKKFINLVSVTFKNDVDFESSVDKAFRSILNEKREVSSSEILSKYSDLLMKKGSKDEHLEDRLDDIIILFKYIDEKDVFQTFYSKNLCKRLLFQGSHSDDLESSMISKMKSVCGYEYTNKLQRMFTDVTLSHEVEKSFQETKKGKIGGEFQILVLTAGAWPISLQSKYDFTPPKAFLDYCKLFEQFYVCKHNGRKLVWVHHLASVEVKYTIGDRKYDLQIPLGVLQILLEFQSLDSLELKKMAESMKLNESMLLKAAKPMIDLGILEQNGGILSLNNKFSSKKTKIKVLPNMAENGSETEQVKKVVDDDRRLFVQVMKTNEGFDCENYEGKEGDGE